MSLGEHRTMMGESIARPTSARPGTASGLRSPASLPARLGQFVMERFSPAAYGPLLVAFVVCGYVGAATAAGAPPRPDLRSLVVLLAVTLAFLRLRVVDELRDAAIDRLGRPDRPLPRGLVTEAELRGVARTCVIGGVVLAAALGGAALATYVAMLLYTWVSGRDFFLGENCRRHSMVYALLHSPIVPLLLAFVWWSSPDAHASVALAGLLLMVWGSALALEISRKTVAPAEERPYVETYSGALGQARAVTLAAGALAVGCLGAAAYGTTVGAPAVPVFLAGAGAILAAGTAARRTRQLGLLRSAVSLLALALLLWPALVGLLREWAIR